MKKIGFQTLGCKVNIYESNAIKNELLNKGYMVGDPSEDCDAFIVNTCSVTNMADAKSRKTIHKMRKLNPDAVLCVMGCYSQTNPEAVQIEGVDIIVGNGNKKDVVNLLEEKFIDKMIEKKINILNILETTTFEQLEVTTYDHTRAFVKIEDGCENFCTYCIIPFARGPVRSKPANAVIQELQRVTSEGYLEVVLAGIHTGRYNDQGITLSMLIRKIIKEVPLLKRLRLSSIEINEVDDDFIEIMKEYPLLANHLHLPIQSGSDEILSKMERKYNAQFFIDKVAKIRSVRPDISITTDVIVGFPYETELEFQKTVDFIKKLKFSKLHVFPYSMRRGTKASLMPQVQDSVKKNRASTLLKLSNQLEEEYAQAFIGTALELIVEQGIENKFMMGHSSNYLPVHMQYDAKYLKKNVVVCPFKRENGILWGEVVKNEY